MKNIFFLLLVFLIFLPTKIEAQTISVEAKVDSSQYLIGDLIHLAISAEYSTAIKLLPPNVKDSLKGLEILDIDEPQLFEKDGKKLSEFKFTLSKYDSGKVIIPSINLFYLIGADTSDSKLLKLSENELLNNSKVRVIKTNPVKFKVNLVQVDLKKDIKDVKNPVKIPYDFKQLLLWALIALILIGVIIYFYLRYKKRKSGVIAGKKSIKLPPHITALNNLRKLREEKLWQQGLVKEYHSRITEIVRNYFEERFNLPALEMTTQETLSNLKQKEETEGILTITHNFLTNADLVKFAKFVPLKSINEEMMEQAEEIINKTKILNEVKEEVISDV